jgi:hypothetical protein
MLAFETEDENLRKHHLQMHSKAVREHLKNLSSKAYWNQYTEAPDYVVMYLQIESSFGAALELERTLNKAIGSLENRFIPQVKKLKEIGGTLMEKEISETKPIDTMIRSINNLDIQ